MKKIKFCFAILAIVLTPYILKANVGSETCIECHDDIEQPILHTPHNEKNGVSCEDCHGSGDRHADDPSTENINTFKGVSPKKINQICLKCHSSFNYSHSSHFSKNKSCLSCHTMAHTGKYLEGKKKPSEKLLITSNSKLCLNCHKELNAKINMPYHHPAGEYSNLCLNCHNPHETYRELRTHLIKKKCEKCHAENKGPYIFPHLANERKGCIECHDPHGSNNANLLRFNSTRLLCLSCHADAPAFHNQWDIRYRNCTACHNAIHGSNTNKYFME
ncbi:cytochrome c family protein [Thermotomaculum hydrothermale]|uniref:Cytochrome c family protein n=1 Tax=Thermotomaculum hydrothermale TaxID=981385 RepID=A0A7R6SZA0_9BACT|nr:cytochrome c3 family protein [Thermotomaculum hydrothermale]BBB32610.1 cytochrome c family protein [Thermotomaculum hydrothermale]